ncbi:MAG TPA: RES family NAD+ phosphorylase [Actinomycetota bacterium]|nr:RES family NAD+ phosphorylase [Actinomycetota bacterium]
MKDLRSFPELILPVDTVVHRVHRAVNHPWWFSRDANMRFDPLRLPGWGVCYTSEFPIGAFVEHFQGLSVIDARDIATRRRSRLYLPNDFRLADCTSRKALSFGISAEIHSSTDFAKTQNWAADFLEAGFDGIRYFARHDPQQDLISYALFGVGGAQPLFGPTETRRIEPRLLVEAGRLFGISIFLPAP